MSAIHPFESAGLGVAPFRVVGVDYDVGPHRQVINGVEVQIGAPGQPMGCCAYCSQGIAWIFRVADATGKRFTVGSDCVAKVGGATITGATAAEAKLRKMKADEAKKAADARIERARVAFEATPTMFGDETFPNGRTVGSYVSFLFARAGRTGKLKAARMVEAATK